MAGNWPHDHSHTKRVCGAILTITRPRTTPGVLGVNCLIVHLCTWALLWFSNLIIPPRIPHGVWPRTPLEDFYVCRRKSTGNSAIIKMFDYSYRIWANISFKISPDGSSGSFLKHNKNSFKNSWISRGVPQEKILRNWFELLIENSIKTELLNSLGVYPGISPEVSMKFPPTIPAQVSREFLRKCFHEYL